jgi:hypothetical protein
MMVELSESSESSKEATAGDYGQELKFLLRDLLKRLRINAERLPHMANVDPSLTEAVGQAQEQLRQLRSDLGERKHSESRSEDPASEGSNKSGLAGGG